MGAVYKAEDTKLHRTVALKFLLKQEPELRERFLREAQAAAALHHPNICTLFEIDEEHGFLAMEFVEGPTLKEKIAERPLKLEEALDLAIQIAQGLDAAHGKRIVHRDIKPGNILLTLQGQVKITDFGLAALADKTRLTKGGESVGTPAYMSPEQVQSEEVDKRADLWSLGVVLYERLSGRLPFGGDTDPAVAYAIVHTQPEPLTALRSGLPLTIDRLLVKALAKDSGERYQNAADLLVDLRAIKPGAPAPAPRRRWPALAAIAAGTAAIAAVAWMAAIRNPNPVDSQTRKFELTLGANVSYPAISPDGTKVAYVSERQLWVRELSQLQPRALRDTNGAHRPFWSPDSEWIGYAIGRSLWKTPVRGGSGVLIGRFGGDFFGATWNAEGSIVLGIYQLGLFEVSAAGGEPKVFLKPDSRLGEFDFHDPHWLPDGKTLLCATHDRETTGYRLIAVRGETRAVISKSADERLTVPVYAPSGHVLFSFDRNRMGVWAVAFDMVNLRILGNQFQVAADGSTVSMASDGTLAYWSGVNPPAHLSVVDRAGQIIQRTRMAYRELSEPSVSAKGKRVAAKSREDGNWDIWEYDLAQNTRKRLTFAASVEAQPSWSPDGKRLVLRSSGRLAVISSEESKVLEVINADGSPSNPHWGVSNVVVYARRAPDNSSYDIWHLKPGESPPAPFVLGPADELSPVLSPDGKYVAYTSNESRRTEVYVKLYPSGEGRWIISANGGGIPRWSPSGDELFFIESNVLMSVKIDTKEGFRSSPPEKLFDGASQMFRLNDGYDVLPGGKSFVVVQDTAKATSSVVVVQNWLAEFKK